LSGDNFLKSLNSKYFWLLFFFSTLLGVSIVQLRSFSPAIQVQQAEIKELYPEQRFLKGEKLDLNRATERELVALPGIGRKLAAEIIRNRTARGFFPTVDALSRVRGIGPAKLRRIRPLVVVSHPAER
jgi:competence ComEA-like helix-hairpin-helix protein